MVTYQQTFICQGLVPHKIDLSDIKSLTTLQHGLLYHSLQDAKLVISMQNEQMV